MRSASWYSISGWAGSMLAEPGWSGNGGDPAAVDNRTLDVAGPCWTVLVRAGRCWSVLDGAGPCWTVLDVSVAVESVAPPARFSLHAAGLYRPCADLRAPAPPRPAVTRRPASPRRQADWPRAAEPTVLSTALSPQNAVSLKQFGKAWRVINCGVMLRALSTCAVSDRRLSILALRPAPVSLTRGVGCVRNRLALTFACRS